MFIPPDLMSVATSPRSPKVAAQTRCPKQGRRGWAAWPRPRHTEPASALRVCCVTEGVRVTGIFATGAPEADRIQLSPDSEHMRNIFGGFQWHASQNWKKCHTFTARASPSYKLEASKEYSTQAPGSADAKPFRWAASEPARPGALGNDHLKTPSRNWFGEKLGLGYSPSVRPFSGWVTSGAIYWILMFNPSTFPVQNVKLRVKRKVVLYKILSWTLRHLYTEPWHWNLNR